MKEIIQNPEKQTLGEGYLAWTIDETKHKRFGTVNLWYSISGNGVRDSLAFDELPMAVKGTLSAEVLQTHRSPFHNLVDRSTLLEEGTVVTLGHGVLFKEIARNIENIGVMPLDERINWLNKHALYKLHSQKVRLYFEEEVL